MSNPYDWQRHVPQVAVPRSELLPVLEQLRRGGSSVVLGGRGMGKSVLLRQLEAEISRSSEVGVLLFSAPPADLTVGSCLAALARGLGVSAEGALSARDLFDAYRSRPDTPAQLVLLYDEFDRYARAAPQGINDPPGRRFFNDLEAARRDLPWLGIAAAGSIGIFVFRDVLGSSFLARADQARLSPFDPSQVGELARPFAEEGRPLNQETLDALYLATGGHPALVTYGLQELWDRPERAERAVAEIFVDFQHRHREFLRDIEQSFSDPALSEAPHRVWELVQRSEGPLSRASLREACRVGNSPLRLDFVDVIHLLAASGMVKVDGSLLADDPLALRPLTSILSLSQGSSPLPDFRERFLADLRSLLGRLHAASADFFRRTDRRGEKALVPESVFAAVVALGFGLLGWQVEREAQQAAGRTDIVLRREGTDDRAVVEVKIWGRNDYKEVHRQIESYWTESMAAGAVVMLTDLELPAWLDDYRRECLDPYDLLPVLKLTEESPIRGQFAYTSPTPDGMVAKVDHFLLRLPRG